MLAALPPNRHRDLEPVVLHFGEVLCEAGSLQRHVYFPDDCVISLVIETEGSELEVGLVGNEGMLGIGVALGQAASPVRAIVQGEGSAMCMTARAFREGLARDADFKREVDRCAYLAMTTAMHIAACNNRHLLADRLARWLLMVRDRLGRDEFAMTQEFMSLMLGVRRAGVTDAAQALQQRNLIGYSRGIVRILDARGLRSAACPCYATIRELEGRRS